MRRALLVLLLAAGSAHADDRGPHREGEYGGVNPGEPAPDSKPRNKQRRYPRGTLSWIGFEARDGGAQVFFQASGPFEVKQHLEGSTLVVHLSLRRLAPNTWRRLDTRFFDNPLANLVARAVGPRRATKHRPARGRGISVRITFKNPREAREGTLTTKTEADGMFYAYLTFPEGTEASGPSLDDPER